MLPVVIRPYYLPCYLLSILPYLGIYSMYLSMINPPTSSPIGAGEPRNRRPTDPRNHPDIRLGDNMANATAGMPDYYGHSIAQKPCASSFAFLSVSGLASQPGNPICRARHPRKALAPVRERHRRINITVRDTSIHRPL